MYIVFEGIDGAGKTSVINELTKRLNTLNSQDSTLAKELDEYLDNFLSKKLHIGLFYRYLMASEWEERIFSKQLADIFNELILKFMEYTSGHRSLAEMFPIGEKAKQKLENLNQLVVSLKEPTTGRYGSEIRKRAKDGPPMTTAEELALFIADRRENMENIKKILKQDKIILQDRSFYSSAAYQSVRPDAFPMNYIIDLHDFVIMPDVLFLLDVDVETALERINKSRTYTDCFEEKDFLIKVRENFLKIALSHKKFIIIDSQNNTQEDVANFCLYTLNHMGLLEAK